MCVRVRGCVCTCVRVCKCVYIRIIMHVLIQTYIQYTYIHRYVNTYLHTYMHTYIYTYIYIYIYIYMDTYIHTARNIKFSCMVSKTLFLIVNILSFFIYIYINYLLSHRSVKTQDNKTITDLLLVIPVYIKICLIKWCLCISGNLFDIIRTVN